MGRWRRWGWAWVLWATACTPSGSGDDVVVDAAMGLDARPAPDATVTADAAGVVEDSQSRDARVFPDAAPDAATLRDMAPPSTDMAPVMDVGAPADVGPRLDAVPSPDAEPAEPEPGPCPDRAFHQGCVFGDSSGQIEALAHLDVLEVARIRAPNGLSPLQGRQLVHGVACEGFFMPRTVQEAFELTDDGVRVLQIQRLDTGARFDWLRVYMGDTEVGYIFAAGTLDLVAYVSDGDILGCTELAAAAPELTCPELYACLLDCDPGDVQCRRPCISATEHDALEAYIELDECAGECDGDAQCLVRFCSEEWMACFGEPPPDP